MNKKQQVFSHFGFSTILMIFITICLVTFAALSLLSANADYKLSKKTADKTTEYYALDSYAKTYLSTLDSSLAALYQKSSDSASYFSGVESSANEALSMIQIEDSDCEISGLTSEMADQDCQINFTVSSHDSKELHVVLTLSYPIADGQTFYEITDYSTSTNLDDESQEEGGLHLLGN